jgi:hypothetical protein
VASGAPSFNDPHVAPMPVSATPRNGKSTETLLAVKTKTEGRFDEE